MDLPRALDIVVSRTGHVRYRELCDPAHPDYNPAYIPLVLRQAEDDAPLPVPVPSVTAQLDMIARMKACPHWIKAGCGCSLNRCGLGKGDAGEVSHADCFACLSGPR